LCHVVVMRPRRDPIEGLKRGITEAATALGRSAEQCAAWRKRIDPVDPCETAYAIRCDLPVGNTETLLIVDQFEELLTETADAQRLLFVDLLMALTALGGFRIVLTIPKRSIAPSRNQDPARVRSFARSSASNFSKVKRLSVLVTSAISLE
jgi:hypothetical protein